MLTLETLREAAGEHAEYLTQDDADHANECVVKHGYSEQYIIECAVGWAHEYARVVWCETRAAEREEDYYR